MITATDTRTVERGHTALKSAKYTVDNRNVAHLSSMLRDMYEDPVYAVIREYSANGYDAQVLAGKPNEPLNIFVPSASEPVLKFRDHGPGLNDDDCERLLFGYGASGDEKRNSNDFVGGKGIGAKCAHAITDQFTLTSFHNGTMNVWQCYRNEDDESVADKVFEGPSTEPSGIEVSVPITSGLLPKVLASLEDAFLFYPVKPVLANASSALVERVNRVLPAYFMAGDLTMRSKTGEDIPLRWEAVKDPDYADFVAGSCGVSNLAFCRMVMGPIAYPVTLENVSTSFGASEKFLRRLIIRAPIGAFQLTPSRESLFYSQRVQGALQKVFDAILQQAEESAAKDLQDKSKTCAQRVNILQSLTDTFGSLRSQAVSLSKKYNVSKDGYILASNTPGLVSACRYTASQSWSGRLGRYINYWRRTVCFEDDSTTNTTIAGSTTILHVMVGDDEAPHAKAHAYKLAVRALQRGFGTPESFEQRGGTNVFVIVSKESARSELPPWLLDGSVMHCYTGSELPLIPDEKMESVFSIASHSGSSSSSSYRSSRSSNSYTQHSRKLNRLKDTAKDATTASEDWEPLKVSGLPDSRIVYVAHDRFVPQYGMGSGIGHSIRASSLAEVVKTLVRLKLSPELEESGLVGVRSRDLESIKQNNQLVSFEEHLKEIIGRLGAVGITEESLRLSFVTHLMYSENPEARDRRKDGPPPLRGHFLSILVQKASKWVELNPELRTNTDPVSKALCAVARDGKPVFNNGATGSLVHWDLVGGLFELLRTSDLTELFGITLPNRSCEEYPLVKTLSDAMAASPVWRFLSMYDNNLLCGQCHGRGSPWSRRDEKAYQTVPDTLFPELTPHPFILDVERQSAEDEEAEDSKDEKKKKAKAGKVEKK